MQQGGQGIHFVLRLDTYTISATGKKSHLTAQAQFTVIAFIAISGKSTYPANPLTIHGQGFGAREPITLLLCSTPTGVTPPQCGSHLPPPISLGTVYSASNGTFRTVFSIPFVPAGEYAVWATGEESHEVATATFVIPAYPEITLSPTSSIPGGTVKVQGQGFAPLDPITISLDSTVVAHAHGDTHGKLKKLSFVVPKNVADSIHTVTAIGDSGLKASALLQISVALLTLSPPNTTPGGTVEVQGQGFAPQESITIRFSNVIVAHATSDTHGNLPATSYVVPDNTADGSYTVTATGQKSGLSASALLTVGAVTGYTITTVAVPVPGATLNGINDAGQIVGGTPDVGPAFVGTPGNFTTFDSPPSLGNNDWDDAMGINNLGQMVGVTGFMDFAYPTSWLDSSGNFTTVTVPGSQLTAVYSLNDAGQIVGQFADSTNNSGLHGFICSSGACTMLDVPGAATTLATGIDNAGEIVGQFDDTNGNTHGFIYADGVYTTIDVPGATFTTLNAISSNGKIVGNSSLGAFLYNGKTITMIDVSGYPTGINASGDIVSNIRNTDGTVVNYLATPTSNSSTSG